MRFGFGLKLMPSTKNGLTEYNKKPTLFKMRAYVQYHGKKTFPDWKCPDCKTIIKLDFSPLSKKWLKFKCPKCGYKVENTTKS